MIKAESALQSTLDDIQDRIEQGYAKEMNGDELTKAFKAFDKVESILGQLDKTRTRFENIRKDFKSVTDH